jgi:MOSC domain-containing protein YiiM
MGMRLLSLNVGLPREVIFQNRTVLTGIFKEPVQGKVQLRFLNLDGDRQADLNVHGGPQKAVYVYPSEHYSYWKRELPGTDLPAGSFGENFTTEGLLENSVHIGDRFRVGSAEVVVTQPRLPCYKLGIKFGRADMVKRFAISGRTGFYLSVAQESEVSAGDEIEPLQRDESNLTVADITRLYLFGDEDRDAMQQASQLQSLPANWRDYFRERLSQTAM